MGVPRMGSRKPKEDVPFLQLTVDEAREVVGELEEALEAHRRWLQRFQTMLVCRTKPSKWDLRDESHLHGEFGRWYYRRANPYLKRHPMFAEVGKHHRKMHTRASKLAALVEKGKAIPTDLYGKFVASVDGFKISLRAMFIQPREMLRYIDPLTGIANRYAMLPRVEQELERIRRTKETGWLVLGDLDHFKRVNDTHGHQAGDRVLQEAARYLGTHLRKYDQIYRYGGEEFLMMLPNTKEPAAERIVDRLRRGLGRHSIDIGKKDPLKVTASFGLAELVPDETVQTIVERADRAMYEAKEAGRNRTRLWTPEMGEG